MVPPMKTKSLITGLIVSAVTFISLFANADVEATKLKSFKVKSGQYIAYDSNIADAQKATLILLPGINRGLDSRDEVIRMARKMKLNFVSVHFSLHPESLLKIPAGETPAFKIQSYTSANLANEVDALIEGLKVNKPIIVSLSYSSSVSTELAKLGKYPLIIETAPMMRFDEADPQGAAVTAWWTSFFNLNPFIGPFFSSYFIKSTYKQYWDSKLPSIVQSYPETAPVKSLMADAYTELSYAAHGFDYRKQNFNENTFKFFILGENELEARLALQKEAIGIYEKATKRTNTSVILPGAGHIVPSDAPEAYLQILKSFVDNY